MTIPTECDGQEERCEQRRPVADLPYGELVVLRAPSVQVHSPGPARLRKEPSMVADEAVIDVAGLTKSFGRFRALNGLDLTVARGQVHGFLGPNGAGKSTTIRVLLGLLKADGGTARVLGGDPWRDVVELHRRLAYVPGDVSLWPGMTGGEAIDLLGALRGGLDERRRADSYHRAPRLGPACAYHRAPQHVPALRRRPEPRQRQLPRRHSPQSGSAHATWTMEPQAHQRPHPRSQYVRPPLRHAE